MLQKDKKDYESKLTEEEIRKNFKIVAEMKPVKIIFENILNRYKGLLHEQIKQFFEDLGKHNNSEYGDILLSNKSAKDISTRKHGFNKIKAWGIGAIKETLEFGKAIYYKEDYKGKEKDRLVIAAPVEIGEGPFMGKYIMGVSVEVSSTTNRANILEMALEKENFMDATIDNELPTHGKSSPSILTLLQQVIDVKNGIRTLDQVTAIGIDSK